MARPRKHPNLNDAPPRLTADGGRRYHPASLEGGPRIVSEREATGFLSQAKTLAHPTVAGYYDPVAITCVVDLLLRIDHDTTLRARDVAELLEAEYPQFLWSPIVVGRILSDLSEAAIATGAEQPPIVKWNSRAGHLFVTAVTPANWRWLADVRLRIGRLAHDAVAQERAGVVIRHGTFPFDAIADIQYDRPLDIALVA